MNCLLNELNAGYFNIQNNDRILVTFFFSFTGFELFNQIIPRMIFTQHDCKFLKFTLFTLMYFMQNEVYA